jgi:tRNA(Glu) U13 pseudouridine synthase TruD
MNVNKHLQKNRQDSNIDNEVFWFLIDNDRLHKQYFHSLAKYIFNQLQHKDIDKAADVKKFMPMVKSGCLEYYNEKKLPGHFEDNFDKEAMKDLCDKLYDHYIEDIKNKQYQIDL